MFVLAESSHQVTIENLLLESPAHPHSAMRFTPTGSNIVIKGCDFENLDSAIVDTGSPTGLLAYNNISGPLRFRISRTSKARIRHFSATSPATRPSSTISASTAVESWRMAMI